MRTAGESNEVQHAQLLFMAIFLSASCLLLHPTFAHAESSQDVASDQSSTSEPSSEAILPSTVQKALKQLKAYEMALQGAPQIALQLKSATGHMTMLAVELAQAGQVDVSVDSLKPD